MSKQKMTEAERKERAAARKKAWREKNKDYNKQWYQKNKARALEKAKEWSAKHPGAVADRAKKWNKEHPEKVSEWNKAWAQNNPDKRAEYDRKWRKRNPEKAAAQNKKSRIKMYDGYVAALLGLKKAEAPTQLLETKREQLTYHRLARELRKGITDETSKDNT